MDRENRLQYEVGDVVTMRKPHPCGGAEWDVLRTGADLRLRCRLCGHIMMLRRSVVEKSTRSVRKGSEK